MDNRLRSEVKDMPWTSTSTPHHHKVRTPSMANNA
jgi:hypothetical protein